MESYELYHHGTLGMKWGVRRYQNKDGSLTDAGKKHRSIGQVIKDHGIAVKRKRNLKKARAAKIEKQKNAIERQKKIKSGKISIKDMTDDEIRARIERLNLEESYQKAMRNTQSYSKGKRFINKFWDSTIDKVADHAAADVVAQSLKVMTSKAANSAFGEEVEFTNNKKK